MFPKMSVASGVEKTQAIIAWQKRVMLSFGEITSPSTEEN
jgi:hypothetical protein